MVTMIPGEIEEFETEGEKAFYRVLEGMAWFVQAREPKETGGKKRHLYDEWKRFLAF